eukprot:1031517-Rhodomonas_salina.1
MSDQISRTLIASQNLRYVPCTHTGGASVICVMSAAVSTNDLAAAPPHSVLANAEHVRGDATRLPANAPDERELENLVPILSTESARRDQLTEHRARRHGHFTCNAGGESRDQAVE